MPAVDFDKQVVIVTGAGGGIGRATALLLARRGAKLLVNDADAERLQGVASEIRACGAEVVASTTSLGSHAASRDVAAAALSAFGRIDVLINNAAITRPGAFDQVSDAQIDEVLAVNLVGPFALMRAVWPSMCARQYGRIVNLSSSAVLGSGMSAAYAASKAGLIGLTKDAALAGERCGIRVNALMPCAHTALLAHHPDAALRAWMKRYLPPERVAAVIAFLASRDMCRTGEVFSAGGGRISRVAFTEGPPHFDPELSPEDVREHFESICDLYGGGVLSSQAQHQASYAALFPRS